MTVCSRCCINMLTEVANVGAPIPNPLCCLTVLVVETYVWFIIVLINVISFLFVFIVNYVRLLKAVNEADRL
jgi:hypothetical protein